MWGCVFVKCCNVLILDSKYLFRQTNIYSLLINGNDYGMYMTLKVLVIEICNSQEVWEILAGAPACLQNIVRLFDFFL